MRPEGTPPPLDAHSLRLQIDEILPVVRDRALRDPDHEFKGRVLRKLLTILSAIRDQYGSSLLLDREIWDLMGVHAPKESPVTGPESLPEPITAEEMQIVLASVRASLLALEELEARTQPYGSAADVGSPIWGSDTGHRDSPPQGPQQWPEGPGDRQYRIVAGRKDRYAVAYRPGGLPW